MSTLYSISIIYLYCMYDEHMVMFYVFIYYFLLNPFNSMHICNTWTTHIATKSWTPRVLRVLRIPRNARKSSSNRPSWPKISTVWVTQRHETFSIYYMQLKTLRILQSKYKNTLVYGSENWCPDIHTHTHSHIEICTHTRNTNRNRIRKQGNKPRIAL